MSYENTVKKLEDFQHELTIRNSEIIIYSIDVITKHYKVLLQKIYYASCLKLKKLEEELKDEVDIKKQKRLIRRIRDEKLEINSIILDYQSDYKKSGKDIRFLFQLHFVLQRMYHYQVERIKHNNITITAPLTLATLLPIRPIAVTSDPSVFNQRCIACVTKYQLYMDTYTTAHQDTDARYVCTCKTSKCNYLGCEPDHMHLEENVWILGDSLACSEMDQVMKTIDTASSRMSTVIVQETPIYELIEVRQFSRGVLQGQKAVFARRDLGFHFSNEPSGIHSYRPSGDEPFDFHFLKMETEHHEKKGRRNAVYSMGMHLFDYTGVLTLDTDATCEEKMQNEWYRWDHTTESKDRYNANFMTVSLSKSGCGVFYRDTDMSEESEEEHIEDPKTGKTGKGKSCKNKPLKGKKTKRRLDEDVYVIIDSAVMGNESRYINDYRGFNVAPNVGFGMYVRDGRLRYGVFLMRPIRKGEMLLLDYGMTYWVGKNKLMLCDKKISEFNSIMETMNGKEGEEEQIEGTEQPETILGQNDICYQMGQNTSQNSNSNSNTPNIPLDDLDPSLQLGPGIPSPHTDPAYAFIRADITEEQLNELRDKAYRCYQHYSDGDLVYALQFSLTHLQQFDYYRMKSKRFKACKGELEMGIALEVIQEILWSRGAYIDPHGISKHRSSFRSAYEIKIDEYNEKHFSPDGMPKLKPRMREKDQMRNREEWRKNKKERTEEQYKHKRVKVVRFIDGGIISDDEGDDEHTDTDMIDSEEENDNEENNGEENQNSSDNDNGKCDIIEID